MKRILVAFLFLFSIGVFAQNPGCKKFKNGKFVIKNAEYGNFYIERKGNTQIEYSDFSRTKLKFKVKWVKDCIYTLTLKKILENPDNEILPENMILTVKIIETKENSYIQQSSSNLFSETQESEIFVYEE